MFHVSFDSWNMKCLLCLRFTRMRPVKRPEKMDCVYRPVTNITKTEDSVMWAGPFAEMVWVHLSLIMKQHCKSIQIQTDHLY